MLLPQEPFFPSGSDGDFLSGAGLSAGAGLSD
jgi:hypothetical protein